MTIGCFPIILLWIPIFKSTVKFLTTVIYLSNSLFVVLFHFLLLSILFRGTHSLLWVYSQTFYWTNSTIFDKCFICRVHWQSVGDNRLNINTTFWLPFSLDIIFSTYYLNKFFHWFKYFNTARSLWKNVCLHLIFYKNSNNKFLPLTFIQILFVTQNITIITVTWILLIWLANNVGFVVWHASLRHDVLKLNSFIYLNQIIVETRWCFIFTLNVMLNMRIWLLTNHQHFPSVKFSFIVRFYQCK